MLGPQTTTELRRSPQKQPLQQSRHFASPQTRCIKTGSGIGACQRNIARKQADLIAILSDQVSFDLELWVVMHEDLKNNASIRAVFEHFAKHLPRLIK